MSKKTLRFFFILCLYTITSYQESWIQTNEANIWYDKSNQCILKLGFNGLIKKSMKLCNISVGLFEFEEMIYTVGEKVHPYCVVSESCHTKFHFQQQIFSKVYNSSSINTNPFQNPLFKLLNKISYKNVQNETIIGQIIFFGDSSSMSIFEAFICEIIRNKLFTNFEAVNIVDKMQHIFYNFSENTDNNQKPVKSKIGLRFINKNITSILDMFNQTLSATLNETNYLVLIVNIGLWYNYGFENHLYKDEAKILLKYLYSLSYTLQRHFKEKKTIKIFWLETVAQHYPPHGYYSNINFYENLNTSTHHCIPLLNKTISSNWRNKIIENIITENKYEKKIKIIPFFNITASLWDHHHREDNSKSYDCTHYCWTPMLYYPVFNFLANSI
jgi:hypothetical protein